MQFADMPQHEALAEESGSDSPSPAAPGPRAFPWRRAVALAATMGAAVAVTGFVGRSRSVRTSSIEATQQDFGVGWLSGALASISSGVAHGTGSVQAPQGAQTTTAPSAFGALEQRAKALEEMAAGDMNSVKAMYNNTKNAVTVVDGNFKTAEIMMAGKEKVCGLGVCATTCCGVICCANGCEPPANLVCKMDWSTNATAQQQLASAKTTVSGHANTAQAAGTNIVNQKGYCGLVPCPSGSCCGGMCCRNGCDPYTGLTCKVTMPSFLR